MSYRNVINVTIDKYMIEEILEQKVPDELYEKYEDDFVNTLLNYMNLGEYVCEVLMDYSEELKELEREME